MWFGFPPGATQISVNNQIFEIEAKDDNDRGLFRAPDHFAPQILDLPGFSRVEAPKDGPPDLPKTLDDGVGKEVDRLAAQLAQRDLELSHYKSLVAEVSVERDELKLQLHEAQAKVLELEEAAEESTRKPSASTSASMGSTSITTSTAASQKS